MAAVDAYADTIASRAATEDTGYPTALRAMMVARVASFSNIESEISTSPERIVAEPRRKSPHLRGELSGGRSTSRSSR